MSWEDIGLTILCNFACRLIFCQSNSLVDLADESALKVLELGSGTGVPGILLSKLGHEVTLTDNEPSVLKLLEENCTLNGVSCNISSVDWGCSELTASQFDLVFASDCCYEKEVLPGLFKTAFASLKAEGPSKFIIANVQNRLFCDTREEADAALLAVSASAGFSSMEVLEGLSAGDADISLLAFYK